jgi:hypothetical protein
MVHYLVSHPSIIFPTPAIPGKGDFQVIELEPWSWSRPHNIQQLTPAPVVDPPRPEDIPDPEYHVTPIGYDTGFKTGQLLRLNIPVMKSSFF